MKTLLLALCLVASAVPANPVWKSQTTTVELLDTRCGDVEMTKRLTLRPPAAGVYTAVVVYKGRLIKACWTLMPDGLSVILLDADGDIGTLEIREFVRDKGI
jgi:hypothetical protein